MSIVSRGATVDTRGRFASFSRCLFACEHTHTHPNEFIALARTEIRKKRGVGPAGEPVIVVNDDSLTEHFAITMMVGFHQPTSVHGAVLLDMRAEGMNTPLDFGAFVVAAVVCNFLVAGDVLVCDNAKVSVCVVCALN